MVETNDPNVLLEDYAFCWQTMINTQHGSFLWQTVPLMKDKTKTTLDTIMTTYDWILGRIQ